MTDDNTAVLVNDAIAYLRGRAWIPLATAAVGAVVRLTKTDPKVLWFPVVVPPEFRGWLAVGLGLVAGIIAHVGGGEPWAPALVGGLVAGIGAISGHELVVESLRHGRDLGVRRPRRLDGKPSSFPPRGEP